MAKLVGVADATPSPAEAGRQNDAEEERIAASRLQAAARGRRARQQHKRNAESNAYIRIVPLKICVELPMCQGLFKSIAQL